MRRQEVSAELDVRRDADVDRQIYDGEIVDDGPRTKPGWGPSTSVTRWHDVRTITTTARTVATHDHTRAAARQVWFLLAGVGIVVKQWRDSHGASRYERMMRAAEMGGDREALLEWEARDVAEKAKRHQRVMDWIASPLLLVKAMAVGIASITGLLLGLGVILAVADGDASLVLGPIVGVIEVIRWTAWFLAAYGATLLLAVTVGAIAFLWNVGRNRATVPSWVAPTAGMPHETVIVTPAGIAAALAHLGIPALSKAIKEGWQIEFATPPVRVNNKGYHAVHSLPMGVTPEMIADKRTVYARNLVRQPLEVWPTAAERAGFLDIWVADQGATEKPAPPYPLLHDGTCDVFAGVPFGMSQRGDTIAPPLVSANVVFGGMMGQGKSNAARVMMAGAALDPIAELRAYVFAGNGDFDAYVPRLTRYERGTGDDVIVSAIQDLQELYAEVGRREERLADLGAKKVTRPLAVQHPDLRPIVAMFSECHELFGHDEHGKMAADLAVQILRRARKTAIILGFDTQSSRKDAIPPKIVELVMLNACFAVKTWRSNDGFLGDGSFQAGIRATELRPGRDRGTSVLTGATEERFELVKWFFIPVDDDAGTDAATDIIVRAMAALHPSVPVGVEREDPQAPRNLLEDLDEVLGSERVRIADVPALLRELAPDWTPYRVLNGTKLQTRLEDQYGVRVARTGNKNLLDPADVKAALSRLATADLDDEG